MALVPRHARKSAPGVAARLSNVTSDTMVRRRSGEAGCDLGERATRWCFAKGWRLRLNRLRDTIHVTHDFVGRHGHEAQRSYDDFREQRRG